MEAAGSSSPGLAGLSILIVEDEYFVASDCAKVLREQGARVLGPVPDMVRARAALFGATADCVLLDVNLKGEMAFDLARELMAGGVAIVFTTSYDTSLLPASLRRAPCLQKPVEIRDLVQAVQRAVEEGGRRPAGTVADGAAPPGSQK